MYNISIKCPYCGKESFITFYYIKYPTFNDIYYLKSRYELYNECNCKNLYDEALRQYNTFPISFSKLR